MRMKTTVALLGLSTRKLPTRKGVGGRPSKASMGLNPDDFPGWVLARACVVLEVVERERTAGKTRKEALLAAVAAWKKLFPMGKLSTREVDNILREYQPECRPAAALRVIRSLEHVRETTVVDGKVMFTGRWVLKPVWVMRFDDRPPYPKRGSGPKAPIRFSKKHL